MGTPASPAEVAFQKGAESFARREIETALTAFDTAQSLGHDAAACSGYRWQCWMLLGEFPRAWRESEFISSLRASAATELWDGQPFSGKRVVIRCLHGYGDAIQFLRYANLVRQSASRVIVETHPEMVSLVKFVRGVDYVTTWANGTSLDRDAWDQQIEVTELPRAFRTDLSSIPANVPYLHISRAAREKSRQRLRGTGRPKVGLVWASSMWNPARCIPLIHLLPLLRSAEFDVYSFQRGAQVRELEEISSYLRITDTTLHSPEIIDTAADLTNVDLLITVDTMAAHLAGALGTNVWTLLPFEADWRWMLNRSDVPWYPHMRLFRQPSPGNWKPVVKGIESALAQMPKLQVT